ncbi:MAG: hypothetical protein ACKVU1_03125 [bacterium]
MSDATRTPPPSYRTQSRDTSYEAEQFYFAQIRALPIWERAARAMALQEAVERLSEVGIRQRFPDATPEEMRLRIGALRVDRETMIRLYDWDPLEKGY